MWLEVFLLLLALVVALYWYITKNFGHYEKLGVPYVKPSFPFGSLNFFGGDHIDVMTADAHKQFENERFFGLFMFGKPMVAINDPDLLRLIQVKDFDHFVDRIGPDVVEKLFSGGDLDNIWKVQLTSLSGDEWKDVRHTFTPIFTSGKMKNMMKFIHHVSKDLVEELEMKAEKGEEFELKTVFGKFSLDALASAAFGVNAESFKNEKSPFVKAAATIFRQGVKEQLINTFRLIPGLPKFLKFFKINLLQPQATKFFRDTVLQTIKMRRQSGERKNDMIDLMLDALHDSHDDVENDEDGDQYENDMKLNHKRNNNIDEITIVGTAVVLLVAGYDTTGMLLSYFSYEMTNNPDIQNKLRDEVDEAFENADGRLPDYSVIQSLPYLDMVIQETLRYHPPAGFNMRTANKDYHLPDSNIILKKGDGVMFNARFLHRRPEHWSHPDEFYPEHFSKEEKSKRNPYVYQAFGQGPRACIGMRFALLEAKIAIMMMMRNFFFEPGTKTKLPLEIDSSSQLSYPKGGLWINIKKRDI